MSNGGRIEAALEEALARASAPPAPPRLCQALRHAVMPGGARIRPFISLSVARACGDDRPAIADAAAAALELIHCGSLVHDDMPCFDDAALRRGRPAVHVAHGEALALLVGDSLIVLAFDTLAQVAGEHCGRAAALIATLAGATGMPRGICAGQGWESEEEVELEAYHRSKTGSLFVAATRMGAIASGADPDAWTDLGARIGEAFQVADDLADATKPTAAIGKPAGQDDLHARPNAVRELGVAGAVRRLRDSLDAAVASIPACPGEEELCALVRAQAARLTPVGLPAVPT